MAKDYDRQFYNRKKNKFMIFLGTLAIFAMILFLLNAYSMSVYDVSIVEVIKSRIGR